MGSCVCSRKLYLNAIITNANRVNYNQCVFVQGVSEQNKEKKRTKRGSLSFLH